MSYKQNCERETYKDDNASKSTNHLKEVNNDDVHAHRVAALESQEDVLTLFQ